jgi:DNA-binding response OmpR family regulator
MSEKKSYLEGKRILAVDDEEDVLSTIEEILDNVEVDKAKDYSTASQKINKFRYDLAILDIMGVDGLKKKTFRRLC